MLQASAFVPVLSTRGWVLSFQALRVELRNREWKVRMLVVDSSVSLPKHIE